MIRELADGLRSRWQIGLRAALCVGVPLLAGVAAGRTSWGALASMGGFAGFYGPATPYRHRLRLTATIGVALAVVFPLGSLCSSRAWLAVLFAAIVSAAANFACTALRVPPPREYLIILAALAGTAIPAGQAAVARECALVAAGAALGVLVTMAPALAGRPDRLSAAAVASAWTAVGDVLTAAGTPAAEHARSVAVATTGHAHETVRQDRLRARDPRLRSLVAADIVLASALSVSIDARPHATRPAWRTAVAPAATAAAYRVLASTAGDDAIEPGVRQRLRESLSPTNVIVPAALRIGVAVAVGVGLGRSLGLGHSYWVGLTAASALQASNVSVVVRRSAHRLAGTVVGVVLAWALFALHPDAASVAVVAITAQFLAEAFIPVSYAVATAFITVVALSVFDLASPTAGLSAAIGARLIDTLIGVVLVVFLRLVLWPRATRSRLPLVQAQTLRAAAAVFSRRWLAPPGDAHRPAPIPSGRPVDPAGSVPVMTTSPLHVAPGMLQARRRLRDSLTRLRAVSDDALADEITRRSSRDQVTLATEELAMLALGVPFERSAPAPSAARALVDRLGLLADAVESGGRTGPPSAAVAAADPGPALPGYPRTVAAVELLESALG
jgi:uncharacterized membrane protein YccC